MLSCLLHRQIKPKLLNNYVYGKYLVNIFRKSFQLRFYGQNFGDNEENKFMASSLFSKDEIFLFLVSRMLAFVKAMAASYDEKCCKRYILFIGL